MPIKRSVPPKPRLKRVFARVATATALAGAVVSGVQFAERKELIEPYGKQVQVISYTPQRRPPYMRKLTRAQMEAIRIAEKMPSIATQNRLERELRGTSGVLTGNSFRAMHGESDKGQTKIRFFLGCETQRAKKGEIVVIYPIKAKKFQKIILKELERMVNKDYFQLLNQTKNYTGQINGFSKSHLKKKREYLNAVLLQAERLEWHVNFAEGNHKEKLEARGKLVAVQKAVKKMLKSIEVEASKEQPSRKPVKTITPAKQKKTPTREQRGVLRRPQKRSG